MFRASFLVVAFAIAGIVHAEPKVEVRLRQKMQTDKKLKAEFEKIEKQKQSLAEKQKLTGSKKSSGKRTSTQIDYSKYDRCPNGQSWDGCDHEDEKAEWLREQQNKGLGFQKSTEKILADFAKRQQEINDRLASNAKQMEVITAEKENFIVKNGQFTFDEEASPDPSKTVVWPKDANSGITIGGLDIAQWKNDTLLKGWLTSAGLSQTVVDSLMTARNLKGTDADNWIEQNPDIVKQVTAANQKQIFESAYSWLEEDVKRIVTKPDVVKAYGNTNWDNTDPTIKALIVDLRFRGDYDAKARKRIQEYVSKNDLSSLAEDLSDRSNWSRVPAGRFKARKEFATGATKNSTAVPTGVPQTRTPSRGGEPPRPPSRRDIL